MSKKRILLIFLLILVGYVLYRYYFSSQKIVPPPSLSVTTSHIQQKNVTLTTQAIGTVQPYVSVSIRSRVEGQILSVGFKEGESVQAGQILFQIDPHAYQVLLDQAVANLARDEAQLQNVKKLLERYGQLVKKGYISRQDYDAAVANVKAQAAAVLADKAMVNNAKLNLEYCSIRAPISGRTGGLLVHQGNLVRNDMTPLVIINQIKPIYITFSLPEQYLQNIQQQFHMGSIPVTIRLKNNEKILMGKLSFIDNAVDPMTGMIQLKALFSNDHEEIWPGQYVDVILPIQEIKQALLIPTRAIQAGPDGTYVFVVQNDSHVTITPITLGPVIGENTIIRGLQTGTQVVNTGQSQLVEGSMVRGQAI